MALEGDPFGYLVESLGENSAMATMQKKALKQVVSIEAYRQQHTKGVAGLTNQLLVGQWRPDFTRKEWNTLLAQLKTEISQFDRAILALTKLATGRGQPFLSQNNAPERKQARR